MTPLIILIILFPLLKNPLSIGLTLLALALLVALNLRAIFSYLWLSYTLVLVLLGGLLVIFIYVALVASNETFSDSSRITFFISSIIIRTIFLFTFNKENYRSSESQIPFNGLNQEGLEWTFSFYSFELNLLTIFLLFYLFLTLIVVVFNTKNNKITLRSQYR